jgi:hypothetical protein
MLIENENKKKVKTLLASMKPFIVLRIVAKATSDFLFGKNPPICILYSVQYMSGSGVTFGRIFRSSDVFRNTLQESSAAICNLEQAF